MIQTVWHISFKKRCIDKEPCIFALVDHLVQELNDRLLSQENRFLGQYPFPAKLNTFNSRVQNKLYKTYKTDLSKKRELILTMEFQGGKQSGLIQLMKNQIQHANPGLYPSVVTIITILLTMSLSTATPKQSFSTICRVKTCLRSTMKTQWFEALALMHAYRDIPIDVEAVIREFCTEKKRRLAFGFL